MSGVGISIGILRTRRLGLLSIRTRLRSLRG